ncbi:hypothetical protein SEA_BRUTONGASTER_165 [Gordonia phage BrutonGaster]|uniref:Uncharacterized protein n=1 Tax=Gordonia phage BrutonGaster TaxID=2530116 RepID=A0A482JLR8_9CAUD|nr:hypothetical protein HOV26_gp017 [Gordonia phage BrutonGaster]QBP33379.1 hypothetical protein SEA_BRUTONGASTER_165 [Gordonia phage BrutonGaster]
MRYSARGFSLHREGMILENFNATGNVFSTLVDAGQLWAGDGARGLVLVDETSDDMTARLTVTVYMCEGVIIGLWVAGESTTVGHVNGGDVDRWSTDAQGLYTHVGVGL